MTDTVAPVPAAAVTRTCHSGNHSRCLGTVYDPITKALLPCACPVADCGHGSDTEKAKRSRRDRADRDPAGDAPAGA